MTNARSLHGTLATLISTERNNYVSTRWATSVHEQPLIEDKKEIKDFEHKDTS